MKKLLENKFPLFKTMFIAGIISLSFVFASCDKEDDYFSSSNQDLRLKSSKAVMKTEKPIAQIAIDEGFSELVAALSFVDQSLNTGLVDLFMNGRDQYTVFAPGNDAFFALYDALGVNGITELPPTLVRDVLLYHVTEGRRAANSVVPKNGTRTIETLLGESFMVYPNAKIQAIGNMAYIDTPNISASNGIIHVITAVILPIE